MIHGKDSKGRPVDFSVEGWGDDAQINEAYYTDTPVEITEAPDDDELEYLERTYAAEIEFEALENAISAAEAYYEGDR